MNTESSTLALLQVSLECAVPLHIIELEKRSRSEIQTMATEASQAIAEHGDLILYRGKKKGESAKAFNALALGVAILAFAPGGVTIFGLHFEAGTKKGAT